MFVITVIPLVRGTQADSLSYYSSEDYEIGTILTVPVRSKEISAVVIETKPASRAKAALRAATFSLRKLSPPETVQKLPKVLIDTVTALGKIYPASPGAIFYSMIPPDVRAGVRPYPSLPEATSGQDPTPEILTSTRKERYVAYKSYIREAFAHRGSVLLVVPNSASIPTARVALEQGIEKRVITLCSTHTKRQLTRAYEQFSDLSKAKLIIATPNFAFLLRHDITHIIVDESGSNHYRARTRPYLDSREVLKTHAQVAKKSILLGDVLPATADEIRRRDDSFTTHGEHPKRISFPSSFTIAQHERVEGESNFTLFTPHLCELMGLSLKNKGKVFLFAARKGLAPLVACFDCGHIFRCPDSGAPYSLWRKTKPDDGLSASNAQAREERWFICSTSGKRVRAADVCPDCGSWRLREQGVGIQMVEDQTREHFPKADVIRFDHETASTNNKAKKLISQFYDTKGAILIGTQMALPYMDKSVDVTAVTSYEALRAIPSWRAEETTLSFLLNLREKTLKDCVVQTRSEPDDLLKTVNKGLIDSFYDEEIAVRESLKYPPYSVFILMTYQGTKEHVHELEMQIEQHLVGYHPQTYNAPMPKPNQLTRRTLLRVPEAKWPDEHLVQSLRTLPAQIKIEVNPERIV